MGIKSERAVNGTGDKLSNQVTKKLSKHLKLDVCVDRQELVRFVSGQYQLEMCNDTS
jgi:hypothetical protein